MLEEARASEELARRLEEEDARQRQEMLLASEQAARQFAAESEADSAGAEPSDTAPLHSGEEKRGSEVSRNEDSSEDEADGSVSFV